MSPCELFFNSWDVNLSLQIRKICMSLHSWLFLLWEEHMTSLPPLTLYPQLTDSSTRSQQQHTRDWIVICSTNKPYIRNGDRFTQLLHHPRFIKTEGTFIFSNSAWRRLSHRVQAPGEKCTSARAWAEHRLGVCELRLQTFVTLFWLFSEGLQFNLQLVTRRLLAVPNT